MTAVRKRLAIVLPVLMGAALWAAARPCLARGSGGFLRDWLVASPPLERVELDLALPADLAAFPGLFSQDRVWLPARGDEEGRLDLQALFPEMPVGTALLQTFFEVPADGMYILRVGSDDGVRVDVDGQTVHRNPARRAWAADQDEVKVELTKGWHRMLVRVVNEGALWAISVRTADEKNRPLDLAHQADVPRALARQVYPAEPVTLEQRAQVALHLARQAARIRADLDAACKRLAALPEGYVTFAEYEGARELGGRFFEALAALWDAIGAESIDRAALESAERAALAAAGELAPGLVPETRALVAAMGAAGRVWERLGRTTLSSRELAEATAQMASLLAQSRLLAARVEREHVLMARLENDIRNFRQRDVTVRVADAEGGPVENAQVEIVQTAHEFLFGCNLFAFRAWGEREKDAQYEQRFARLFNLAVLPFYWSGLEKRGGEADFTACDRMLEWAARQRIRTRAHPLLWQETVPSRLEKMTPDEARRAAEKHVRDTVARCREKVDWWDVLHAPQRDGAFGPFRLAPAEAFQWAADARPRGRLILTHDDPQELARLAGELRAAGAPLDGVGILAHQHDGAWPPDLVRRTLDRAAQAGLPVHVSAVTLLGGREDEERQAEAVRRFYTAAFAHPKVVSISWWDLSDKFAWKNAPAGLLREDLSPKAAYRALDRLVNHLWRTDAAGRTGEDGRITVRAFYGAYRITAREGRRKHTVEAHLDRGGPREIEVILPGAG